MRRQTYALMALLLGVLHGVRGLYLSPAHPWITQPVAIAPLLLTFAIAVWYAGRAIPFAQAALRLVALWLTAIPVAWALYLAILAGRAPMRILLIMLFQLSWTAGLYLLAALCCLITVSATLRRQRAHRAAV
jgi:hypothetical protein